METIIFNGVERDLKTWETSIRTDYQTVERFNDTSFYIQFIARTVFLIALILFKMNIKESK